MASMVLAQFLGLMISPESGITRILVLQFFVAQFLDGQNVHDGVVGWLAGIAASIAVTGAVARQLELVLGHDRHSNTWVRDLITGAIIHSATWTANGLAELFDFVILEGLDEIEVVESLLVSHVIGGFIGETDAGEHATERWEISHGE